jgi:hypothetical protein
LSEDYGVALLSKAPYLYFLLEENLENYINKKHYIIHLNCMILKNRTPNVVPEQINERTRNKKKSQFDYKHGNFFQKKYEIFSVLYDEYPICIRL